MNCGHARGLFGAYWDDDTTQAEREWLEGHLAKCERCRLDYEAFSRPLEALATLPRVEASPDFAERVLARARHAGAAPDRLPVVTPNWVPLTAAAALLLIGATLALPWLGGHSQGPRTAARPEVREPALVRPVSTGAPAGAMAQTPRTGVASGTASGQLFDHSADVEFILDPVTLKRGHASLPGQTPATQEERAIVSF